MPRDPDAGTGEAPDPETCPATSSSGCSSSVEEKETSEISECKRQFNCESLEEALEIARQCAALKKEGWNEWNDNTWEQTLKLRYLLTLAAKPDFVPPARFQQAMETCMKCLLHAPQGQLMQPARLLQLLDSPEAGPLLRYLTWLEEALKEGPGSDPRSRTVLVPQRVCSALCSWPAERSLLQQSAAALWEVLLTEGPQQLRTAATWREAVQERQVIQKAQTEECHQIARQLQEVANFFVGQVEDNSGTEWPKLARVTQESLYRVQQVAGDLLQNQKECWSQALEDYEALGTKASSSRMALMEVQRKVRRHEQAFGQAAQRFTEVANQLVAWTSALVPSLQLLETRRAELRTAVEMRQKLLQLEREHLTAEDELDTAQTELRKQKRRLQASSNRRRATSSDATTAGYILEQQCELRVSNAQKRADALQDQIRDAEKRLLEAESSLPLELGPHDEESSCHTTAGTTLHSICRDQFLSNEERLALKLATLQQFHEEIVEEAAQSQQEHDNMLRKVEQRKIQAALKQAVEPDFMCPILHERMKVPVLAADGFTYERQAIEKWLSMHNTSPMTGAVLVHRYLTENFALRHLIETYEAQLSEKRTTEGRRAGVSKTCISPPLSELSDEADSYMDEEWSNEAPSRRMVRMEEDMPILSHQVDDG